MRVLRIVIRNILGLESLDIRPGRVTEILGENGTGKTSCLEAIRAALGGGHDATLLKQGATEGEVILLLDDGTEIKRRITEDRSETTVTVPEFGRISKPASYIRTLADALSLNPVRFLTAARKERVDQLLQAIPMQVTADQITFVPTLALSGVDLDEHALTVIGKIHKAIYDQRTGVNRAEKEKRGTIKQMTETLPEDAPEGNWGDVLQQATTAFTALQDERSKRFKVIETWADAQAKQAEDACQQHIEEVKAELEKAIEKLRTDAQIEIDRTRAERDAVVKAVEGGREERRATVEQEYRPREDELKEKIGQAKAMVEQHTKAESTRQFIAQLTQEADQLAEGASKLTLALGRLEALKAGLLQRLPIPGLEVKDGDIFVDGIPFDRVNTAKKVQLAIEVARLRAGSLGLVAVDGLECLDPKTFEAFRREAAKADLQFVISRVTEGPLEITTEGEVE